MSATINSTAKHLRNALITISRRIKTVHSLVVALQLLRTGELSQLPLLCSKAESKFFHRSVSTVSSVTLSGYLLQQGKTVRKNKQWQKETHTNTRKTNNFNLVCHVLKWILKVVLCRIDSNVRNITYCRYTGSLFYLTNIVCHCDLYEKLRYMRNDTGHLKYTAAAAAAARLWRHRTRRSYLKYIDRNSNRPNHLCWCVLSPQQPRYMLLLIWSTVRQRAHD